MTRDKRGVRGEAMGSSVPLSTHPEGKEREAQKKRTGAGSRLRGTLREEIGRLKTWANEGLPTGLGRAFLCLHVFSVM